ncbi:MAG: hypothetical protein NTU89_04020 [Candidatus Dependentiae bacterium]|nr:hypothetical protein [Candidatus Dependentiae bacterium]
MKYSKKVLFTLLSILSIQTQTKPKIWMNQEIEKLESDRYPLDETKEITLTMPSCEENIWVYVEYGNTSQRLIFSKENSKQNLELIKPNDAHAQFPNQNPQFRVSFVPETDAQTYLNFLKNRETTKETEDGVILVSQIKTDEHNQAARYREYTDKLKEFNNVRKQILRLDFNNLKDGQMVTIPAYQSDEQIKQAEIKKSQMNAHHIESDMHSIKMNQSEQNIHGINLKMIHPEEKHTDTGIHLIKPEDHAAEKVDQGTQPTDLTEEAHSMNKEA